MEKLRAVDLSIIKDYDGKALKSSKESRFRRAYSMSTRKLLPGATAFIAATFRLGFTAHGPSTTAHARSLPDCSRQMTPGTTCNCALSSLHPMQAAVGMLEVEKRVKKIEGLRDKNKLEQYEHCKSVPVVIGPNDPSGAPRFYVMDQSLPGISESSNGPTSSAVTALMASPPVLSPPRTRSRTT